MADVIRDVVIRLTLQQAEAKLKAPDFAPIKKAEAEVDKLRDQYAKADQRRIAMAAEENRRHAREREALAIDEEKRQQSLAQMQTQVAGRLREAGEGAFILARGLALTFSGTEEGLQRMLKNVAQVQGMFDIFKGGTKLVQNLGTTLTFSLGPAAALIGGLAYAWNELKAATETAVEKSSANIETYLRNLQAVNHQLNVLNIQGSGAQKVVDVLVQKGDLGRARQTSAAAATNAFRQFEEQREISEAQAAEARRRFEFTRTNDPANARAARAEANVGITQADAAVAQSFQAALTAQEADLKLRLRVSEIETQKLARAIAEMEKEPYREEDMAKVAASMRQKAAEQNKITEDLVSVLESLTKQNVKVAEAVARLEEAKANAEAQGAR